MNIQILRTPIVQKVLPCVYDESLSYYEVLCKMKDALNKAIVQTNQNTEDIATLQSAVAEIQTWIDDFDSSGCAMLTGADFIGAITTTSTVTAAEGFIGNLTGDTEGTHTGNVVGDVTGDVTGNVTGTLTGNSNGTHTGDVVGNVRGNLTGNVTGDVTGNVHGDVTGDVAGDLTGNVTGNLTGNVSGNVTGNVTGNVSGNVTGTLTGESHGTHYGGVVGNVTGDLTGNADTASALETPRSLTVDLEDEVGDLFDGSQNVDLGIKGVLPVAHGGTGSASVDTAPTAGSAKMVTSGGVKTALDAKQDTLTFDTAPTQGSVNPVTSGGVYEAISQAGVGVVSSVFGRVGQIVAADGDYNGGQIVYNPSTSGLEATRVQGAIDELKDAMDNLPHSLATCSDVVVTTPTNGQVLTYDATQNKWVNANAVSGIAPDNVSDLNLVTGNGKVTIKWSDPQDTVVDGVTICTWARTKLVMKTGGYPSNVDDGTVILTNSVRDQYKVNGYEVTGLTNGTTYYFQLFPISDGNAVNNNVANRVSGTPTPTVQITLTLEGAKEDTITIRNSDNELIGTCVFESGQTSGTFTTIVNGGYSDTWSFTSAVAKDLSNINNAYSKSVTVDTTPAQTIKVMPEGSAYWFGNEVVPWIQTPNNYATTFTKNTNNMTIQITEHVGNTIMGCNASSAVDVTNKTSYKIMCQLSNPQSATNQQLCGYLSSSLPTYYDSYNNTGKIQTNQNDGNIHVESATISLTGNYYPVAGFHRHDYREIGTIYAVVLE